MSVTTTELMEKHLNEISLHSENIASSLERLASIAELQLMEMRRANETNERSIALLSTH